MKVYILILLFIVSCGSDEITKGKRVPIFNYDEKKNNKVTKSIIELTVPENSSEFFGEDSYYNNHIDSYKSNLCITNKSIKKASKYIIDSSSKNLGDISNIVIVKDAIYTIGSKGSLTKRLRENPSKIIWKKENIFNEEKTLFPKITYHNNVIFVTSEGSSVFAVNAMNGEELWKREIKDLISSYPVVNDNSVYFISKKNKTYSLNANSGKINWIDYGSESTTSLRGFANPVIYKDKVISFYSSGEIVFINIKTGEQIFNQEIGNSFYSLSSLEVNDINWTPIVYKDTIYVSSANGKMTAINLKDKKTMWQINLRYGGNMARMSKYIFAITEENEVFAINSESGEIYWQRSLPKYKKKNSIFYKSIDVVNDHLMLINSNNEIYYINIKNGDLEKTELLNYNLYPHIHIMENGIYAIYRGIFKDKLLKIK